MLLGVPLHRLAQLRFHRLRQRLTQRPAEQRFGDRVQFDVGVLGDLAQHFEPRIRWDPVDRGEDTEGLVDHRAGVDRVTQLSVLLLQACHRGVTGAVGEGPWYAGGGRHHQISIRERTFPSAGDGLLMAASDNLGRDRADHLAAVVSGITSLAQNASTTHGFHGMKLVMIESFTPRRAQLVK